MNNSNESLHTFHIQSKDGIVLVHEYFSDEGLEALAVPLSHNVRFTKDRAPTSSKVTEPRLERFKTWLARRYFRLYGSWCSYDSE